MKSVIFAALAAISLAGCVTLGDTVVDKEVVTKYKYVINDIPAELTDLPPRVEPIDVKTATDKEVADWLVRTDLRMRGLQAQILSIRKYLDEKIKSLNIPKEDLIINK